MAVNVVAATDTQKMPRKKLKTSGIILPVFINTQVVIHFCIGFARIIIPIVAINESNKEGEKADDGEIISINESISPRKFKESVRLRNTFPNKAHDDIKTALVADTEKLVIPKRISKIGTVTKKRGLLLLILRKSIIYPINMHIIET